MEHSLNIFQRLISRLPPLFPAESAQSAKRFCAQCADISETEQGLVAFGFCVWPYNKAHNKYLEAAKKLLGTHLLLPHLPQSIQDKLNSYQRHGMNYDHWLSGETAEYFTPEERVELSRALIDTQDDLRNFTEREVLGAKKREYLASVKQYQEILNSIKIKTGELKELAGKFDEHQMLRAEILDRVRTFEHGFCDLAPEPTYHDVCRAVEHFHGRNHDLNRMRGLHIPLVIDFYGEGKV